jgi:medium-chain acyl-[acyl-carrier-protein] hydrolase
MARSLLKLNAVREAPTPVSLFCFPFAGGSAHFYQNWGQQGLGFVQGYAIELPGRGLRLREPLIGEFCVLIENLAQALAPVMVPPYALFGHSLGALLAFEFVRAFERLGSPMPVHLFLSACRAPHLPRRIRPWHALPEDELIAEIEQLAGTPPGALHDEQIREMMVPVFRADFQLGEDYSYVPRKPISVPVSVFGGASDPLVTPDELDAWSEHTDDFRGSVFFPGGHFYLTEHASDIVAAIGEALVPWTDDEIV